MAWVVAKTCTKKPDKFQIHPINGTQFFDPYRYRRIEYAPGRTGRINHLPMIMGICGAYAIRRYADNLILAGDKTQ